MAHVLLSLVNAIDVLELRGLAEHNTHATVARLSKLDCPFHRLWADVVTGDDVLYRNLHEYFGVNFCPYSLVARYATNFAAAARWGVFALIE